MKLIRTMLLSVLAAGVLAALQAGPALAQYFYSNPWGYGSYYTPYYGEYHTYYGDQHLGWHSYPHWSPGHGFHWGTHYGWHDIDHTTDVGDLALGILDLLF